MDDDVAKKWVDNAIKETCDWKDRECNKRIAELEAEVAELREYKARLDWLNENVCCYENDPLELPKVYCDNKTYGGFTAAEAIDKARDAVKEFVQQQRPLDPDGTRILYDNLWDVYETDGKGEG